MSPYSIEHISEVRESFGPYRYRIYVNGIEFALFWHNHRGECEGVRHVASGREEDPPFGMCSDFLSGGGTEPLGLTKAAQEYLDTLAH